MSADAARPHCNTMQSSRGRRSIELLPGELRAEHSADACLWGPNNRSVILLIYDQHGESLIHDDHNEHQDQGQTLTSAKSRLQTWVAKAMETDASAAPPSSKFQI